MEKIDYKGSFLFNLTGFLMLIAGTMSFIFFAVLFIIAIMLIGTIPFFGFVMAMLCGIIGALSGVLTGIYGMKYSRCPSKMKSCLKLNSASLFFSLISFVLSSIIFRSFSIIAILLTL
ncbi:MAG: hypothetical protein IJO48_06145, partial [Clostridia bacterium]|nr:hypothetical protein [Clostridia bacterium]